MKLIHLSDVHLDSNLQTNLDAEKAKKRKAEIVNTFERVIDYANDNGATAVLIAGDLFDTPRITKLTRERVSNLIVNNSHITFFYVTGNHEEKAFLSGFENIPENLKTFSGTWQKYNFNGVTITGASQDTPLVYDALNLNENDVNIVMLHGQTVKHAGTSGAETISLTSLANKNINYLALGHIHYYVSGTLDKRGVYAYSGCLEGRGYDECGKKGFVLITVENGKLVHDFIPFAKRTVHEVEVNLSSHLTWQSVESEVLDKLSKISASDMVKITLTGKYDKDLKKNVELLNAKLDGKFYAFKIKDESIMKIAEKDLESDLSLRGEFLRQVLRSKLTEEEKEGAIVYGLKALDGEDL